MPIKPPANFERDIAVQLNKRVNSMRDAVLYNLMAIGEQAVNVARTQRKYRDQTGNLTSSVGYIIFEDGQVVNEGDFNAVSGGGKGASEGRAYARSLATQFPTGITLVVVAGMNYAAYVERRGIGGMTASELYARNAVKVLLDKITK